MPYLYFMKFEYQQLLPDGFAPESRVWIYQSSRLFSLSEALEIEAGLEAFTAQWNSHGDQVKGFATLLFGQFILIMADETYTGVSGCSTDSSVRMVKEIEQRYQVQLFDRLLLAFIVNDKVELLPMAQLPYAVAHGKLNRNTLFFNNMVQTRAELENRWIIPAGQSWLGKKMEAAMPAASES